MSVPADKAFFEHLYQIFSRPLSDIDCGARCGPFNEYGVPVCCDIHLIIPSAYEEEWEYLAENTDLWQPWSSSGPVDQGVEDEKQDGQVLLKCLGYQHCQRPYRTLTCRAFPFFPYINSQGQFIGLAYFQEYREMCWIISNLSLVTPAYKADFRQAFRLLFRAYPESKEGYTQYSMYVREEMAAADDRIILLDFDGDVYLVDPDTEISRRADYEDLGSYGPFSITKDLRFPDENAD